MILSMMVLLRAAIAYPAGPFEGMADRDQPPRNFWAGSQSKVDARNFCDPINDGATMSGGLIGSSWDWLAELA